MHVFYIPLSSPLNVWAHAPVCCVRVMTSQQAASQSTATAHQINLYYTWSYNTQIVNAQWFDSLKRPVPTP